MNFKNVIFFILITLPISVKADSRTFDRTWLGLFNKKKVSEHYSIWVEGQARMDNDHFTNNQLLLRTGVLRPLNEKIEVGLLYCHVQTGELREHRPTFQLTYTFFKNQVSGLQLRNRLEYRKLEDNDVASGRYRGALRYQHKFLVLWEEPFLNMTSEEWTGKRLIERNRFFVGPGLKFNEMNLEVGYLNQYTPRHSRAVIEHILAAYLFY